MEKQSQSPKVDFKFGGYANIEFFGTEPELFLRDGSGSLVILTAPDILALLALLEENFKRA